MKNDIFDREDSDKMDYNKIIALLGVIFSWILMALILFSGEIESGNVVKSVTYGISVGNSVISAYICRLIWTK